MSDDSSPVDAGPAPTIVSIPGDGALSLTEAYEAAYEKPLKKSTAESADDPPPAEPELSDEDNSAPETDPAEETQEPDPDELPPIERPRSWTKDVDDDWKALPRSMQEKIASREQDRETALRRSQNDAAEKAKGLTAKEQAAEQARQQYESRAKAALAVLEREQLRDFPDIKTMADVTALSQSDPLRYLQWDAHQKEMVAAHAQAQEANTRQATEQHNQWTSFVQKENALAVEHIPDLGDKDKGAALTAKAADLLRTIGFNDEDLTGFQKGEKLSPMDHRFQRILFDAIRFNDAKAAVPKVVKTVPQVQRPGVSKPSGSGISETEKTLTDRFNRTGSLKDAQALYALQSSRRK